MRTLFALIVTLVIGTGCSGMSFATFALGATLDAAADAPYVVGKAERRSHQSCWGACDDGYTCNEDLNRCVPND